MSTALPREAHREIAKHRKVVPCEYTEAQVTVAHLTGSPPRHVGYASCYEMFVVHECVDRRAVFPNRLYVSEAWRQSFHPVALLDSFTSFGRRHSGRWQMAMDECIHFQHTILGMKSIIGKMSCALKKLLE